MEYTLLHLRLQCLPWMELPRELAPIGRIHRLSRHHIDLSDLIDRIFRADIFLDGSPQTGQSHHTRRQGLHMAQCSDTLLCCSCASLQRIVVGTYAEYPLAVSFYAGNLCMIGLLTTTSWIYIAGKGRLISEDVSRETYVSGIARGMMVPLVSIIIIIYANLVSASNSTYLFLLIPAVMYLISVLMKRIHSPDKKTD